MNHTWKPGRKSTMPDMNYFVCGRCGLNAFFSNRKGTYVVSIRNRKMEWRGLPAEKLSCEDVIVREIIE